MHVSTYNILAIMPFVCLFFMFYRFQEQVKIINYIAGVIGVYTASMVSKLSVNGNVYSDTVAITSSPAVSWFYTFIQYGTLLLLVALLLQKFFTWANGSPDGEYY